MLTTADCALPSPIHLEAIERGRNMARGYSLWMSRDLFGQWLVETRWGRIGARGQRQVLSFADTDAAMRHVQGVLRRRAGLRRRTGVGYRVVGSGSSPLHSMTMENLGKLEGLMEMLEG